MKPSYFFLLSAAAVFVTSGNVSAQQEADPSARIDQLVIKNLRANDLQPNAMTDDETFVRRIHLDLIGRIPTRDEAQAFIQSTDDNKRAELIDELIGSDGYVSHHYNYWADILRARTNLAGNGGSREAGLAYERWIKEAIRENKPYDEMVRELVSAHGTTWTNPAVGYYIRDYGMSLDNLAITSQVFLGTQIVCAQCHDHPFDSTTQMDYYHLAAFTYGQVTTNSTPLQNEAMRSTMMGGKKAKKKAKSKEDGKYSDLRKAFSEILFPLRFNTVDANDRDLRLPHDYQYDDAKPKQKVEPASLFGPEAPVSGSQTRAEALGEWMTSPDNPRFTKVIANRLWKKAMGLALIEPLDDLKDNTESWNPELMAYLEQLMVDLDYDLQAFQRVIYNTKTYQRQSTLAEPVPGEPYHFAGPILRRMSAEQIWDSLVTMAVENPDQPSAERELEIDRQIAEVQLIAEAVYDQTPEQFMANALEVSDVQKQLSADIEAAREKSIKAREEGDPEKIREASKEVQQVKRRLEKLIEEKVYREGLAEKIAAMEKAGKTELVAANVGDDDPFLAELASTILSEGDDFDSGMNAIAGEEEGNGIVDQLVDAMFAEREAELRRERDEMRDRQKEEWDIAIAKKNENLPKGAKKAMARDRETYRSFTRNVEGKMLRASEMNSPTRPGHFLREFGQSDRELVENSSDSASITQALAMLNGPITSAITNRYSVLSRDMKGENFRDRLDTIYETMLSRKPTPEEVAIFREAWEADPESGTVQGIVWTILNTRQFLFIQ